MLTVADALALVLARAAPRPRGVAALTSSTLGQVLSDDLLADVDSPPFDKALMDGFAVRAADLPGGAGELALAGGHLAAGVTGGGTLGAGEAVAIATGAPLPAGADAVVKVEQSEPLPGGRVRLSDPTLAPGRNVMFRGTELRAGDVALPAGTVISPVAFGLCAAVGKTAVPTVPPARVAILVTGDELVEANTKPGPGQIRNTNGPMLVALTTRAGALPRYLGIGRDDEMILTSLVREGLATADVLVTCGGVSVGKRDLTPAVLAALGVETQFHQVRMKPGKPLLFGTFGPGTVANKPAGQAKLVFGLPGNPVSAFVGFELFVRPALRALAGLAHPGPPRRRLVLSDPLTSVNDRPTFHPGKLTPDGLGVAPLKWAGSADLRAVLGADALLELPAGAVDLPAGSAVDVVLV